MSLEERFQRLDRNGDGKLTRDELPGEWLARLDANQDGVVTRQEVEAFAAPTDRAYHAAGGGPVPLSDSKAFTDLVFRRDWLPGTEDAHGRLMTGTECNYIVAHRGRLYAAISMWNHDSANAPNPGPSVLVKPSAGAPWEVDACFGPPSVRVAVLASLTFSTDAEGAELADPVTLLVAGGSLYESTDEIAVFIRDDQTGRWAKSVLTGTNRQRGEVRLLRVHRDRMTGVDRVIAALTNGNVFTGAFDPSSPGRVRWEPEPELSGRLGRIMSCGEANGDAYLAVDITPDQPGNGGLFRRVDGAQPRWEWIGEWGHRASHRGVAWIRGLTAIPDAEHPGRKLLLCSGEVDGVIEVINPQRDHEHTIELDLRRHFGGLVGAQEGQRFTTIFAYNEMTPAVHPDTGERVLLIGGGIMPGLQGSDAQAKCAWCLVRHTDGR